MQEGSSGYFAKHFMKHKEATTDIHYNIYSNHLEALKLAMLMSNTFEVGGIVKKAEMAEIYIKRMPEEIGSKSNARTFVSSATQTV